MKIAGCILLVLAAVVIAIGVGATMFFGKDLAENVEAKSTVTKEAQLEPGKEVRLEDVTFTSEQFAPLQVIAALEVQIAPGAAGAAPKGIPYSIEAFDQQGKRIDGDTGELTESVVFPMLDPNGFPIQGSGNSAHINLFRMQDQQNQESVTMTVDIVARVGTGPEDKAIESARVAVLTKEFPMGAAMGVGFAFLGALCGGGALGLIGLVLLIIGLASGNKQAR